jgi:hypothetical protein
MPLSGAEDPKYLMSQVDVQIFNDEIFPKMRHQISSDSEG